jgi:uncharacterized protein (UPF0276 family)
MTVRELDAPSADERTGPASRRGGMRTLIAGRDAMAAARPGGVGPDIGFSTDSLVERDLATSIVALSRPATEVSSFSAAALAGQDDLVDDLRRFAEVNDLDIFFHALDLDPCGIDTPDPGVLRTLAEYAQALGSPWITTDLAMWVRNGEKLVESLLPMPLVDASIPWVADRISYLQDVTQMLVVGENPPFEFVVGDLDILDTMAAIAERADCGLCLDVGHLHMLRRQSQKRIRRGADADLPWERFVEMHISGVAPRACRGGLVIADQHRWPIEPDLWETFDYLMPQLTHTVTCIAESEGMSEADLVEKLAVMEDHIQAVTEAPGLGR